MSSDFRIYVNAQSAQWLSALITVHWIFLENSSIHPPAKSDQSFYPLLFHKSLNKIARQKSDCIKELPMSKTLEKLKSLTNQYHFYHYTTFYFVLQSVLFYIQLMSTKKQVSSSCKLFSVYQEIPEKFSDETDVSSYFCHNIWDISQSHHRIVRVSKGTNKKSSAFKVFHFCDSFLQQRFFIREEVSISKKWKWVSTWQLGRYSQSFCSSQQSIADSNTQNLNLRLVIQKQKANCSVIDTKI